MKRGSLKPNTAVSPLFCLEIKISVYLVRQVMGLFIGIHNTLTFFFSTSFVFLDEVRRPRKQKVCNTPIAYGSLVSSAGLQRTFSLQLKYRKKFYWFYSQRAAGLKTWSKVSALFPPPQRYMRAFIFYRAS